MVKYRRSRIIVFPLELSRQQILFLEFLGYRLQLYRTIIINMTICYYVYVICTNDVAVYFTSVFRKTHARCTGRFYGFTVIRILPVSAGGDEQKTRPAPCCSSAELPYTTGDEPRDTPASPTRPRHRRQHVTSDRTATRVQELRGRSTELVPRPS